MIDRRHCLKLAAASALAPALRPSRARAQTIIYPTRYVRLVVPFAPAGGADAIGRIMAGRLSEMWGQQVVVENKGGAGGNIAAELVAHAEPDGYTLFLPSLGHAINRFLFPSLNYDPIADFAPVALATTSPLVMFLHPSVPATNLKEFIAYAKANPGKLNYGSSGPGSSPHLATELLMSMAGIQMTHIPYKGIAPAITAQ
ncbi:MAG TPA: tripartite tricarboxylate transporter substrate-binding protein, partial [Xanthobacteraceae bacterium]|nr:tripartite tricarboxylate transporter substrate-binding protein [Xanthobacteraceae bacterium]